MDQEGIKLMEPILAAKNLSKKYGKVAGAGCGQASAAASATASATRSLGAGRNGRIC